MIVNTGLNYVLGVSEGLWDKFRAVIELSKQEGGVWMGLSELVQKENTTMPYADYKLMNITAVLHKDGSNA